MSVTLDIDVRMPNKTKMPWERWQADLKVSDAILGKCSGFICKSKQSINGNGVEAEIHSEYDKNNLHFQFRLFNATENKLKELAKDCKVTLEETFKMKTIIEGVLQIDSGKKEKLNF